MDSKKLAAFLTVCREGSLTKAAETLNYTQSGMTHMMNALEKELGVTLLQRGRNGIALTSAGKRLRPAVESFVVAAEALETELSGLKGRGVERIRVGAYTSMAQHWLPEIINRFKQEMPGVGVDVQEMTIEDSYTLVKSGALDCAFVSRRPEEFTEALDWIPLHNDELVAILPEDYPVRGALVSVEEFDGQEFFVPAAGFVRELEPVFSGRQMQSGFRNTELDDPVIISMVEHGLGLSILSELVMRGRKDRVQALPLTPPAYRELGVVLQRRSNEQEPLRSFLAHACRTVMELYRA